MVHLKGTLLPFLYPCSDATAFRSIRQSNFSRLAQISKRCQSTEQGTSSEQYSATSSSLFNQNAEPTNYGRTTFADKATITLSAGSGGHGCISFLREKFVENGPANGGDGGSGGNVYIQAVKGERSLHKLARRSLLKAKRGKNGAGRNKGGQRGEDVLVQVPVGTVVREVSRHDPVAEEEEEHRRMQTEGNYDKEQETRNASKRDKWILHPSSAPSEYITTEFPKLPEARKSHLAMAQPEPPISLDLSQPMKKPILLAAGAVGGLGNPHFITSANRRPRFASKGETGMTLTLELELKLLADVGFVGMPNAGKSTLLRALSRSKARVGDWAFTTLHPNIGTMVLDDSSGRPQIQANRASGEPRTQVSVADIPGLIMDAHKDKGLGLGFLRHIERAQVLAFVIDLSAGDAVESLKILWNELSEFEKLREKQTNAQTESRVVNWKAFGSSSSEEAEDEGVLARADEHIIVEPSGKASLSELPMPPISSKPWFVVATKADLEGTQENFVKLQAYLSALGDEAVEHPSKRKNGWRGRLAAIPVSALKAEGVERIPEWTVGLLDD
ncbi:GTPase of the mitochondrial inner membrane that associates with the large ribosomal subunit [Lecanora helva]